VNRKILRALIASKAKLKPEEVKLARFLKFQEKRYLNLRQTDVLARLNVCFTSPAILKRLSDKFREEGMLSNWALKFTRRDLLPRGSDVARRVVDGHILCIMCGLTTTSFPVIAPCSRQSRGQTGTESIVSVQHQLLVMTLSSQSNQQCHSINRLASMAL
jgi:hypothetical protein